MQILNYTILKKYSTVKFNFFSWETASMFERKDWRHINRKNIQQNTPTTTLQLFKCKEVHWIRVRRKVESLYIHARIELLYVRTFLWCSCKDNPFRNSSIISFLYARIISGVEDTCLERCHQNDLHKVVDASTYLRYSAWDFKW